MQVDQTIPPVLGPQELAELLRVRPDVRLLDVRTPGEFESAHIPGAYNVPLDALSEHAEEIRAAVGQPVVLVCQTGSRARQAEEALRNRTMSNLHVLEGGVSGWIGAGQTVNRGRQRLSLERQVRIVAGGLAATGGVLALLFSPRWALLPAFIGSGLVFAGVTDTCGMAMVLAKLPYNRAAGCDVEEMVAALKSGSRPTGAGRASLESTVMTPRCAN